MRLCIPVLSDQGIDSSVCSHFGSAPGFLVVDVVTGQARTIANCGAHHSHGACQPLQVLQGEQLDAVIVGEIGQGALRKILAGGLRVYRTEGGTAREALQGFRDGHLREVTLESACGGHGCGSV